MLESLMLSSLGAVLKETVGPLAKAAAEDWCKDRLKQGANAVIAQSAPSAMKKAVKQSLKNFIQLFGDELENCGLTRALVKHELAKPVGRLLADEAVITELCRAFETGVKGIDWQLLPAVWSTLSVPDNFPEEFEWEALARNYVRRVKGLVRKDEDLARQLELDQQRAIKESNEALVGVPVQFDLREYQESLKEKFGSLSLDSLDTTGAAYDSLRLWKIFVAQDVRECAEFAPQLYELPKERLLELQAAGEIDPLLSLDALEQRRRRYAERPIESVRGVVGLDGAGSVLRCVILGDPGSGKSTLLRALALGWAEKPVAALRDEPIPLLIELRLYAQDKDRGVCNDFLEYLHGGNTACRLNQLELDALLKSGKAVALFDGVDEVFDPVLREAVVTDIHRFSNRYPVVQMVVTSRWLGYKAEALRKAEFAHYMLQDLSDEQIEDFLERWHGLTFTAAQKEERERKQARLQRAIGESKAIRELGGNPLLLTMMAILNRNQELPRDRARLYEEASKVLLYQWDVEGKLYEQADLKHWQIDVRDKQAMLRKVAHHMQANENGLAGNVISRDDLEEILTDYLKTRDVDRARPVARVMIGQLRERNFILCYLGANNYAFVHRTFLEYFCANEFVHQFEKEKTIEQEDINKLYVAHLRDESWVEVLRLIAGMIQPRFVGAIIDKLLEQPVHATPMNFANTFAEEVGFEGLMLSVDCLSEVRNRSDISKQSKRILERIRRELESEYPCQLTPNSASSLAKSVAICWKNEISNLEWLKRCVYFEHFPKGQNTNVPYNVLHSILSICARRPDVFNWIVEIAEKNEDWSLRTSALQALSESSKQDETIPEFLELLVCKEKTSKIRSAALQEILKHWKTDIKTFDILKKVTLEDDSIYENLGIQEYTDLIALSRENPRAELILSRIHRNLSITIIRKTAVTELSKNWKEELDTLPLLTTIIEKERTIEVCCTAMKAIGRQWPNDASIINILEGKINGDKRDRVRTTALEQLAKIKDRNGKAFEIIEKAARLDESDKVRSVAIEQLATIRIEDSEVFKILESVAKQDRSNEVRCVAIKTMEEGWKNSPLVVDFLKSIVKDESDNDVLKTCINALTVLCSGDFKVFSIFEDLLYGGRNNNVRVLLIEALSTGWQKEQYTSSLFIKLVGEEADEDIRDAAIEGLLECWNSMALAETGKDIDSDSSEVITEWCHRHPDVFSFLSNLVRTDNSELVRTTAMQALAEAWPHYPGHEIVYDIIKSNDSESVREAAISYLPKEWIKSSVMRVLLFEIAKSSEVESLCTTAMKKLITACEDDETTRFSLLPIIKTMIRSDKSESIREKAVRELVRLHPRNSDLIIFLKGILQEEADENIRISTARAIFKLRWSESDMSSVLNKLLQEDDSEYVRITAIELMLRMNFDGQDLPSILTETVQRDENAHVRVAAARGLLRTKEDRSNILSLFKKIAIEDTSDIVRIEIAQKLSESYAADTEIYSLLARLSKTDKSQRVRALAVQTLSEIYYDYKETLQHLLELAQYDESSDVRTSAIAEIAWHYSQKPSLFDFWCDRTLQAPFKREYDWQDNPRQIALQVLVHQYPDHPKILELLKDRVQNDTDEKFRTWANQQISRLVPATT